MNRSNDFNRDSQNVSILSSSSLSSNGTSRISAAANTSLMNGNGRIIYRRSPVQLASHQLYSNNSLDNTSAGLSVTSYTSEETSETLDFPQDDQSEENISDLSKKFDQLQRQFQQLTETQINHEDRYKRAKQENDVLLAKIHGLEDQLRELELNSETRAKEDEKRFKDTMAKQIKARSQECEQHLHANYLLQQELFKAKGDLLKSEALVKTLRSEKETLEVELVDKSNELNTLDEEAHKLRLLVKNLKDEERVKANIISILNEELEDSHSRSQSNILDNSPNQHNSNQISPKQVCSSSRRSSVTSGSADDFLASSSQAVNTKALKDIDGLETSLMKLRDENKHLREANEELQAQLLNIQLEEGRSLVQEGNKSYSLADEMGDIDVQRLMKALKEQQDDNASLRRYIDDILLRIVEKHPELLDKTVSSDNGRDPKSA